MSPGDPWRRLPPRKPAPSSSWGPKLPLLRYRWRPVLADTSSPHLATKGPRQLFGLSLLVLSGRARGPSDFFAVLMDQGRSRSVAPTRSILRPQTRYKGRGSYARREGEGRISFLVLGELSWCWDTRGQSSIRRMWSPRLRSAPAGVDSLPPRMRRTSPNTTGTV